MSETEPPLDDGELTAEQGTDATTGPDPEMLAAELEILREENQRLRESYARAKRSTYRRTALGFALLGACSLAGAVLFPVQRTIFIAFGGIGVFTALVTYYLTPETFVSAGVTESVYETLVEVESALVQELELHEEFVYVPTPDAPGLAVRLYIPQHVDYEIPTSAALRSLFVTADAEAERGVSLPPIGDRLYREFDRVRSQPGDTEPDQLAVELTEAITEQFELATGARVEPDDASGRVTVGLTGPAYGDVTAVDHPIVSLLATGFAADLDFPVTVTVRPDRDRVDAIVTLEWETDGVSATNG